MFFEKTMQEKMSYLEEIEKRNDPKDIDTLIGIMEKETVVGMKEKILLILGEVIDKSDYSSLEKMFLSSDVFTRNGAVEILRESKGDLYRHLERLSKHENKDVRKFVIDSLKEDSSAQSLRIIGSRLADKDINIRMTAVEYLSKLNAAEYADEIERMLLAEDNLLLICTALESLAELGVSGNYKNVIEKFKANENPVITLSFIKYLGAFAMEDDFDILVDLAERDLNFVKREFIDSVENIKSRLNLESLPEKVVEVLKEIKDSTKSDADKYEIIKILSGEEGDNEKLVTARKNLNSTNMMEVLSAIEIIGNEGSREDIDSLELIADSNDNDEILEAIGDAVEKIVKRST